MEKDKHSGYLSEQSDNNLISAAVQEYEELLAQEQCKSDQSTGHVLADTPKTQFGSLSQYWKQPFYGYEDKKSVTIKPVSMFADLITLKKERDQKKAQIRIIEKENTQLKAEYERCLTGNQEVEDFLKHIDFTFKNDMRLKKANQVMAKAKESLYSQAKENRAQLQRTVKRSQGNTIQELKVYIRLLEEEKMRLSKGMESEKQGVAKRIRQQDFNRVHVRKYEDTRKTIKDMLQKQCLQINAAVERYKICRMQVGNRLRVKEIQYRRKELQEVYSEVKKEIVQKEGLQYQIQVLEHRRKDKQKEAQKQAKLQEGLRMKEISIVKCQKQLREKNKTYYYMLEWTKDLKKKLDERKSRHLVTKSKQESLLAKLSQQYEEWSRLYKSELIEEQVGRKKGTSEKDVEDIRVHLANNSQVRAVKMEEIHELVRRISFEVLAKGEALETFIVTRLLNRDKVKIISAGEIIKYHLTNNIERGRQRQLLPAGENGPEQNNIISLKQLVVNLGSLQSAKERKNEVIKLARYVVEDDAIGKIDEEATISVGLAKVVLKNLLKGHLQKLESVDKETHELKNLLNISFDSIRHDLILGSSGRDIFDTPTLQFVLGKYTSVQHSKSLVWADLIQFLIFKKYNVVCTLLVPQFDAVCEEIIGRKLVKQEKAKKILML